jgi:hypothetical protein
MKSLLGITVVSFALAACGSDSNDPTAPAAATSPSGGIGARPQPGEPNSTHPRQGAGGADRLEAPADPLGGGGAPSCTPKPVTVPPSGVAIPFLADTRLFTRAHLSAVGRTAVDGEPSPLTLELHEGALAVASGWDVCVDASAGPSCFANLEMDPGIGVRSFVLRVTPRAQAAIDATVEICVFDPLER